MSLGIYESLVVISFAVQLVFLVKRCRQQCRWPSQHEFVQVGFAALGLAGCIDVWSLAFQAINPTQFAGLFIGGIALACAALSTAWKVIR